jgi:hypothetical protein
MDEGRLPRRLSLRLVDDLPHGARVVLERDALGRCVFLEPGPPSSCTVHARLGEAALASACRQFPRVATLLPRGVSVTLSHYCPTAAGLLFESGPTRIVEDPPAFPPSWPFEGLDARSALPPLLRPGVLASWDALERWEEHAVGVLADDSTTPDAAVTRLAADVERARAWTPADGDFDRFFTSALDPSGDPPELSVLDPLDTWDLVASTVPSGHPRPARPAAATANARTAPAADRAAPHRPIRRWLAGRAFASWLPLQGPGLRTAALGLAVALAVLRAERMRDATADPADTTSLRDAIRRADLLLVHLADPKALAGRLGACERGPAPSC